jgi:hypothetical protein
MAQPAEPSGSFIGEIVREIDVPGPFTGGQHESWDREGHSHAERNQ